MEVEYLRWQTYWLGQPEKASKRVVEVLQESSKLQIFPGISILLQIFATIPVTTATNERSFSSLKLIKNYLRSTIGETRLNGLASLYLHRDLNLDHDAVISEFAKKHRRLDFV